MDMYTPAHTYKPVYLHTCPQLCAIPCLPFSGLVPSSTGPRRSPHPNQGWLVLPLLLASGLLSTSIS